MPSDLLKLLYENAREALSKNDPPEVKIIALKVVISQAEDEIQVCDGSISESKAKLVLISPNIYQKIDLNNNTKFANLERDQLVKLREEVEKLIDEQKALINPTDQIEANCDESAGDSQMKIFISHSEKDEKIAKSLVDYLLSALALADDDIRCTSVPGHKLPFGKSIAETLRDDLALAPALIVLVTEESIKATWVMFELGAAWGLKKDIFPILAPGVQVKDLPSLLSSISCILIEESHASSRLSDLVKQLSSMLKLELKSGGKPQANLENFVSSFRAYKSKEVENPVNDNIKSDSSNDGSQQPQIDSNDSILRSIWKLDSDHSKHSDIGYHVKAISATSGINIPICETLLDSLVEVGFVSKKSYISPRGDHYKLEKKGREYLINRYPNLATRLNL